MSMKITLEHVDDLARGAAILGTGGGGDPYLGALMLRQAIVDYGPVELVDVESLDDEAFMTPFGMMGAPTVIVEKVPNGAEMVEALRALERYVGEKAQAVMCAEIGGINALLPLVLAARCGLPLVDGDGMGRAFPQLQMTTYHIGGVSAGPMIMADEYCNAVVINSDRAIEIERLGRSMVVAMGGSTNICLYPMHGADAKRTLVRGTVSLALELGRTVREARGGGGDPFAALLKFLRSTQYYQHCRVLFEGKTVDLLRETKGGWALGKVVIEGTGGCAGRQVTIQFQNEHLVVHEGERVLTIVPDLIAVLDAATAEPITTEGLKYGQRVAVLGISAAPIMRTPGGARRVRAAGIRAQRSVHAPGKAGLMKKTRIELITPIITEGIRTLEEVEPFMRPDLTITQSLIAQGPASIESEFDEAISVPYTIRRAIDAEKEGANAIIIDCMGDPGPAGLPRGRLDPGRRAQPDRHARREPARPPLQLHHRAGPPARDGRQAGRGLWPARHLRLVPRGRDPGTQHRHRLRRAECGAGARGDRGRQAGRRGRHRARLHRVPRLRRRHAQANCSQRASTCP